MSGETLLETSEELSRVAFGFMASKALFGSCYQILTSILPKFGVTSTLVDARS